ncbi:GNAT family N-acetyltransferase [Apibacter sp. B2966]|uniref:GNAT family N-acetyltransferase n=1 Tax=Apibacter sp. B2966 TaxID=2656761 RepID=UPI00140D653E|nr:GNAT family N-acetyltransferase [Apibacter sp. B2966]QII72760.1 GNAT family N-acetyltransferase [Apibacter sp. B2966]
MNINIVVATEEHYQYAEEICETIYQSAIVRGTGIAKRTPEYIQKKMDQRQAILALDNTKFAGFCYIEKWQNGEFVVHSGLIVHPDYRGIGLAKKIKHFIFDYTRKKFPEAKIFGITTGLAVMKINSELGYKPVPFSELTEDPDFWNGCKTCTNFNILRSKQNKMCLCTGMLFDPKDQKKDKNISHKNSFDKKVITHLNKIKEVLHLKSKKDCNNSQIKTI